jgi:REP element-mobilizing transposase RayT
MPPFDFVSPLQSPFVEPRSRGELPHLIKEGCTYFVTFRQRDAVLPAKPLASSERKLSLPDEIAASSDPPLTVGSCVLAQPAIATPVQTSIRHFDSERYQLLAWCVMPNHVHVVVTPGPGYSLGSILHSWKSYTATRINRILHTTGVFWERESFDHLIRAEEDCARFVRYTEQNPVAAQLCKTATDWPFSSASHNGR